MNGAEVARPPCAFGWLLALGAGLTPPLALLAPLGLAPLFGVLGAGAALGWIFARHWPPWRGCAALLPLGLFILWATVSSAWSPDFAYSFWRAARLAGETACGLLLLATVPVLRPCECRRLQLALLTGLILAALLASIDLALGNAALKAIRGPATLPTAANRAACVMVLCLAPALLGLWRDGRWRLAAGSGLLILATVLALASDAARLAAILALAAALLGGMIGLLRRRYALLLRFGIVTLLLGMPFLLQILPSAATLADQGIKASGLHRLLIWQFGVQRLMEKPVAGWGLEAARMLPGGKRIVQAPLGQGRVVSGEIMPLHPHNGPLQVWLELGAVGAALLAATLALALRRLFALAREPCAVLAATSWCLAALVIACLSYGLWQSWWLGALWLSAVWLRVAVSGALASHAP